MDPLPQTPTPFVELPSPHKTFTPKFIGLVLLLLVLGGISYGAIWYWQKSQTAQVIPTFTPRATDESYSGGDGYETDDVVPVAGEVPNNSSWKTYRNKQYGFEFKYPSQGEVAGNLDPVQADTNGLIVWPDSDRSGASSLALNISVSSSRELKDAKLTTFAGKVAYLSEYHSGYGIDRKTTTVLNSIDGSGQSYYLVLGRGYAPVFDQILSTFKFINNVVSTTSPSSKPNATVQPGNYKTYSNSIYGFNFNYPSQLLLTESPYGNRSNIGLLFELDLVAPGEPTAKHSVVIYANTIEEITAAFERYNPIDIKLGKRTAQKAIVPVDGENYSRAVVFTDLGYTRLMLSSENGDDTAFEQIISSFKFTK